MKKNSKKVAQCENECINYQLTGKIFGVLKQLISECYCTLEKLIFLGDFAFAINIELRMSKG